MKEKREQVDKIEQTHKILNKNFMIVAFVIVIIMAFIILISIGMNNNIYIYK